MQKKKLKSPFFLPQIPISSFHIEVDKSDRGFSLLCSGVKGISEFSESRILLRLSRLSLCILGSRLYIKVLEGRCVEIVGDFSEVKFVYAKN